MFLCSPCVDECALRCDRELGDSQTDAFTSTMSFTINMTRAQRVPQLRLHGTSNASLSTCVYSFDLLICADLGHQCSWRRAAVRAQALMLTATLSASGLGRRRSSAAVKLSAHFRESAPQLIGRLDLCGEEPHCPGGAPWPQPRLPTQITRRVRRSIRSPAPLGQLVALSSFLPNFPPSRSR